METGITGYSFPVGQDVAFKFGCGRFRMEEHLLERCAEEVLRFGHKPLFVCNDLTHGIAYGKVHESLHAAGVYPSLTGRRIPPARYNLVSRLALLVALAIAFSITIFVTDMIAYIQKAVWRLSWPRAAD